MVMSADWLRLVAEVESLGLEAAPRLRQLIARFVEEYSQARHDHGVLTQDVKFLSPQDLAAVESQTTASGRLFCALHHRSAA